MSHNQDKDEAIRGIEAGFADVLFDLILQCSAPIFWYDPSLGRRAPIKNSGTAFFVDAGEGVFGVTAYHVIDACLRERRDNPQLACQIGGIRFEPEDRYIAGDGAADVATFRFSSAELSKIQRIAHAPSGAWPPKPPDDGKGVFFGGYRGRDRVQKPGEIEWGLCAGLGVASNIDRDHLTVQFNRDEWVCRDRWAEPTPSEPWNGASGGPAFTLVQDSTFSWRLAGAIVEFNEPWEILRVSSLVRFGRNGDLA